MTTAVQRPPFAERTKRYRSSAMRELLALSSQSGVISFAGGTPAKEGLPYEYLQEKTASILERDGAGALQYGPTEGYGPLREAIAAMLRSKGMDVESHEVIVTTGSQQGLDLLARVFLDPGSRVILEGPSYAGAVQAFDAAGAVYGVVGQDEEGMLVEELDSDPAAFLYALPNFQNPTGRTLSDRRREAVLAWAERVDRLVVEDDPYGELRYDGEPLRPIKSRRGGERVIYLGTFSKVLAPGLRVGYVAAKRPIIDMIGMAKQSVDLHTDGLAQRLVAGFLADGMLPGHVERLRALYRERRDAMLRSLAAEMPPGVEWTRPEGGLFLWLTLPDTLASATLLPLALAAGVAFIPGGPFHPQDGGQNTIRLCFSAATPEEIALGIGRLGKVLREALGL